MVKKPFKLKKEEKTIETCRRSYHEENLTKVLGRRGFVFTDFMTERQRIERLEGLKKAEDRILVDKKLSQSNEPLIKQPNMRFKPRLDMERIIEAVNEFNFGAINKNKLEKQLESLHIGGIMKSSKNVNFAEYRDKNRMNTVKEESAQRRKPPKKMEAKSIKKLLKIDNMPKMHFRGASTFIFKSFKLSRVC